MSNEYGSIVLSSVVHNISSDSEPFVTSQPVPNTSRGTNALGAAALNALEAAEYGRPKKSFSDSILDLAGGVLPAVRFGTWGWVKARAADTVLILELAVQLWTYLGVGECSLHADRLGELCDTRLCTASMQVGDGQ